MAVKLIYSLNTISEMQVLLRREKLFFERSDEKNALQSKSIQTSSKIDRINGVNSIESSDSLRTKQIKLRSAEILFERMNSFQNLSTFVSEERENSFFKHASYAEKVIFL